MYVLPVHIFPMYMSLFEVHTSSGWVWHSMCTAVQSAVFS